jgi:hypothetical protein
MANSCEQDNEPSSSIDGENLLTGWTQKGLCSLELLFLKFLEDYQFLILQVLFSLNTIPQNSDLVQYTLHYKLLIKLNSVALARERTIPTERPPLAGEVSANFCG